MKSGHGTSSSKLSGPKDSAANIFMPDTSTDLQRSDEVHALMYQSCLTATGEHHTIRQVVVMFCMISVETCMYNFESEKTLNELPVLQCSCMLCHTFYPEGPNEGHSWMEPPDRNNMNLLVLLVLDLLQV
ncbi:hypothetical protein ATANTOWER_009845 [Ataeniobius toweri]|uniref:Uncharacterized protein n=1 Tax=Ataeniobius toweri TaxID=208326 RepID=A0ABU7B686_9TELE|nr:hypothetical protein [Ataeniobius toweri]